MALKLQVGVPTVCLGWHAPLSFHPPCRPIARLGVGSCSQLGFAVTNVGMGTDTTAPLLPAKKRPG